MGEKKNVRFFSDVLPKKMKKKKTKYRKKKIRIPVKEDKQNDIGSVIKQ